MATKVHHFIIAPSLEARGGPGFARGCREGGPGPNQSRDAPYKDWLGLILAI